MHYQLLVISFETKKRDTKIYICVRLRPVWLYHLTELLFIQVQKVTKGFLTAQGQLPQPPVENVFLQPSC